MKHFTREQAMEVTGARPDQLAEFEALRLVIPTRPSGFLARGEEYYTESQLEVLRLLVKTRRAVERARRVAKPRETLCTSEQSPRSE